MDAINPILTSLFGGACTTAGLLVGAVGSFVWFRHRAAEATVESSDASSDHDLPERFHRLLDDLEAGSSHSPRIARSVRRIAEEALRQRIHDSGHDTNVSSVWDVEP
jgi:hypothetical protein